jgi:hypothetical protein
MSSTPEHFTVHVALKHVTRETTPNPAGTRGIEKVERVVKDVTDVATSGPTKKAAIEKAIRLLQVELEDES